MKGLETLFAKQAESPVALLSCIRDALHYAYHQGCVDFRLADDTDGEPLWPLGLEGIKEPPHLVGLQGNHEQDTRRLLDAVLSLAMPFLSKTLIDDLDSNNKPGKLLALFTRHTILLAYQEAWSRLSFSKGNRLDCKQEFWSRLYTLIDERLITHFALTSPGLIELTGPFESTESVYKRLEIPRKERGFFKLIKTKPVAVA